MLEKTLKIIESNHFRKFRGFLTLVKGSVLICVFWFCFFNSSKYVLNRRLWLILSSHLLALENVFMFFSRMQFCSVFKFTQDLKPWCPALPIRVKILCRRKWIWRLHSPRKIKEPTFSSINFFKMHLNISYFSPKCILIQMLEHSIYLLKTIKMSGCFKKDLSTNSARVVLFFCFVLLFDSGGKKRQRSPLTPPPHPWRNQRLCGVSWPSPVGTESWIRFLRRLPNPVFITGNISGKQNSQHVYSSGSKHLKEEKPNRNSDLFPLRVPLPSVCANDGVAGVAVLLPATEKGRWISL